MSKTTMVVGYLSVAFYTLALLALTGAKPRRVRPVEYQKSLICEYRSFGTDVAAQLVEMGYAMPDGKTLKDVASVRACVISEVQ